MSSFNVTWKSDAKPPGKVFARKRKHKSESANDNSSQQNTSILNDSVKQSVKTKLDKHVSVKKKINQSKKLQDNITQPQKVSIDTSSTKPTKLVKRKKKKDKLLAKLAADSNQNSSTPGGKPKEHSLFSVGNKEVYVKSNPKGKSVVQNVFSGNKKFSDLDIHKYIISNLEKIGYTNLMTVQEKSIPVVLCGKNVLIKSQTGSGKTLAYAVPILNALQSINPKLQREVGVQAVIIVPTRELALQTHELFGKINTFQWIVVGYLCGGENRNTEKNRLRKGVHVLIATPGRLLDHLLHTMSFKIDKIRCLVLDEADRLLDMGFMKDIVRIVEEIDKAKTNSEYDPMAILRENKIKKFDDEADDIEEQEVKENNNEIENVMPLVNTSSSERQTILLSATLNKGIGELAEFTMKDHVYVDALEESSTLNPQFLVIPSAVKQKFMVTHVKHRLFTLSALLVSQAKNSSKVFVFMGTSTMVDFHYELFTRYLARMPKNRGKLKSGDIVLLEDIEDDSGDEEEVVLDVKFFKLHGSMEQSARKDVFTKFRAAKAGILLCTDVVARGIDVPAADYIVQYNGPQTIENYIHRVGRTGRAGKTGTSLIFLTHEEQDFITKMEDHKVYLQKFEPDEALNSLSVLMEEEDQQKAALALQRFYERAIVSDKELHRLACLAYCSWSRFYNTYPGELRKIFDFKKANLGHYVTSFGLKETPSEVAKMTRKQVEKVEKPRLNKKLANHEEERVRKPAQKKKIRSLGLTTSEFDSGLGSVKRKKKKMDPEEM